MTILATSQHERSLDTEHLLADLRGRSVRGGAVTLSAQGARFMLHMGSTAVLARLLTPADFGLVAMVAAFTGFVGLFKDLGLSMATVQRAEVTHDEVSTLFWINVLVSMLLMGMAAALAPVVAWFYGEPRLTWIMLAIAGTFVCGGLTAQHTALLRRQMQFTRLAGIDIIAMAGGISVAIIMAWRGCGYWSLIGMGAATAVANMVLIWILSPWRPGFPRRAAGVIPMLKFGGNLSGFSMTNYLTRNADNMLIGWCWGAEALGLYSKAYNLLLMPIQQVTAPVSSVALPALCRLQGDPVRFRNYYLKALLPIVALGMPLVAYTFVFADELILMVMGPQWTDAILVYRILAIVAFIDTFAVAVGWIFIALGQVNRQFRWQIFESAVTILCVAVGLQWGAIGVATGFCVSRCLLRYPVLVYCYRYAPLKVTDLLMVIWRPAVAAAFAGLVTHAARELSFVGPAATLLIGTAVYLTCYLIVWTCLPGKRPSLLSIWHLLQQLKSGGAIPKRT